MIDIPLIVLLVALILLATPGECAVACSRDDQAFSASRITAEHVQTCILGSEVPHYYIRHEGYGGLMCGTCPFPSIMFPSHRLHQLITKKQGQIMIPRKCLLQSIRTLESTFIMGLILLIW